MTLIETYRGHRVFCRSLPVPGSREYDCCFITLDWPGIWFTLTAIRDYIDFKETHK
jgi:hypothetical protein